MWCTKSLKTSGRGRSMYLPGLKLHRAALVKSDPRHARRPGNIGSLEPTLRVESLTGDSIIPTATGNRIEPRKGCTTRRLIVLNP